MDASVTEEAVACISTLSDLQVWAASGLQGVAQQVRVQYLSSESRWFKSQSDLPVGLLRVALYLSCYRDWLTALFGPQLYFALDTSGY